jgi:hypothetical protein
MSAIVLAASSFGVFSISSHAAGIKPPPEPKIPVQSGPPQYGEITCDSQEQVGPGFYHEHAHLAIYNRGKNVPVSDNIGIDYTNYCIYWVHTHSPSLGVIHIEAPHKIVPSLGVFFKIWKQKLDSKHVGPVSVKKGQKIEVFVNGRRYTGNPGKISLHRHTDVTIEVGPPFVKPKSFNWKRYGI